MYKILSILRKTITGISDWFYQPFSKYISLVTFRYGFTGGLNTVLDIFLYFVFYNFVFKKQMLDLGFYAITPHIAAFLVVFPITFTTGFMLAKYVTFTQSKLKGKKQLLRYGLTVMGAIALNYILLKFFVETCDIWATVSKIITTGLVVIYSYFMQRYFSFSVKGIPKS
ncbi:MAG: GtrA family protein [Bacteroidales bacterium]|nr:GtrA family protein [Bacteroidales bacterium]MDD4218055.1 GtrA family protein [Bacteroidales bacterium]MDY0142272.1 GtrA family protein [Bacteroidales bacterium]